jgi:hypothetical protein
MTAIRRCGQAVPSALTGNVAITPRCNLEAPGGDHKGDHRASMTLAGVGKVIYKWRGQKRGPVEVHLPKATADHLHPERARLV